MQRAVVGTIAQFGVLLLVAMGLGADWPQFRGAARDGILREKGLAKTFPAGGLKILWREPLGAGWSSPVVADGRVFVTDAAKDSTAKERVLCLDARTGATRWIFTYAVSYPDYALSPAPGMGPTPTPVVQGGRVFILGANGEVHCLEPRHGGVVWSNFLGKKYQIPEMSCRASPFIEGELLILFVGAKPGASLLALDKKDGHEIWKALEDHASASSPLIVDAAGKRQMIVWTAEAITSLNPKTGAVYWREPMVTSSNDSIPMPIARGNRALVSGLMLELDTQEPGASVVWPDSLAPSKRLLSNTSNPVWLGDYIYSARSSGDLVCLEAVTGKQVWQSTNVTGLRMGASIHITPCGDLAYLFTDEGNLVLAQLMPAGYREISRAKLLEPTSLLGTSKNAWIPPSFANGCVFARNDREIVCASLKKR